MNKRDLEELMKLIPSGTPGGISPDGGSSWGDLTEYISDILEEEEKKRKAQIIDIEEEYRKVKEKFGTIDLYTELIYLVDSLYEWRIR